MDIETEKKKLRTLEMTKNSSPSLFGSVLVSTGILLVTVGGSWDITNHLLNKPETFFSPPHALLYIGVGVTLVGTILSFVGWKKTQFESKKLFLFPMKMMLLGAALLISSGPFDFFWHDSYGLDGLLSPPHLALIAGMMVSSIGAMMNVVRSGSPHLQKNHYSGYHFLVILVFLPIWLSTTGLFYSLTLPFSNTAFFDFNPNPTFAVIFTIIAFPFLSCFLLLLSWRLTCKFGIISIIGILFLLINGMTAIVPNVSLVHTIPFYTLNFIPFLAADCVVNIFKKSKKSIFVAGIFVAVPFYLIYFPLITHTFNEVLAKQTVWPSLTSKIYFGMIPEIFPMVTLPALVMGIVGAFLSRKLYEKIIKIADDP